MDNNGRKNCPEIFFECSSFLFLSKFIVIFVYSFSSHKKKLSHSLILDDRKTLGLPNFI